jgi:hypothetical protein
MAPRGRLATFNDDLPRRIGFEREARRLGLSFSGRFAGKPRRLTYRVPIVVPVYDEERTLSITMPAAALPGARPLVRMDGPVCMRHRFDDGGLCMWFCGDSNEHRWIPDDGLYALASHAIDHAYCEACCRRGHPWPKAEMQHLHPDCPTCRSPR